MWLSTYNVTQRILNQMNIQNYYKDYVSVLALELLMVDTLMIVKVHIRMLMLVVLWIIYFLYRLILSI